MNATYIINDHRRKLDRRSEGMTAQFPVITTQGICIRRDRRSTPERRISSIVVKEWTINDSIFELLFNEKEKKNTDNK